MARSRAIDGPYELHPSVHLLTSKDAPGAALQRAGHGQIVETPDGQVYHTHLCSRPLKGLKRSPLGRETAIQKCVWGDDGWLRLAHGGQVPAVDVPAPFVASSTPRPVRQTYSFSPDGGLPLDFQWLRTPHPERIFSLTARPGWLRLYARELIGSWFEQALVARRQEHFVYRAEAEARLPPVRFPAGGWPDRLLQPHEVPLPRGRLGRNSGALADHPELRRRLSRGAPQLPARGPDPASAPEGRSASRFPSTRRAFSSPTR